MTKFIYSSAAELLHTFSELDTAHTSEHNMNFFWRSYSELKKICNTCKVLRYYDNITYANN